MKNWFKKYFILLVSVFVVKEIIPALQITGGWSGFITSSFYLFVIIHFIKPLVDIILLPINLLTFNFIHYLFQLLFIYLWVFINNNVDILPWNFSGLNLGIVSLAAFSFKSWQVVILVTILLRLIPKLINWLIR